MNPGGSFRAFVAVDMANAPGAVALLERLRPRAGGAKLVAPENLHVTLKFLGNTPEAAVPAVREATAAAVERVEPHRVRLRGVGTFPPRGEARVLWVGLEGAEPLEGVSARLTRELAARKVPQGDDKPFRPHLTLARARRGGEGARALASFAREHADAEAGEVPVEEVRLMKSDLGPRGPTYATIERVPLEG